MALIYEWGFYLEPGAGEDLRTWLSRHEEELARSAPESLEYLGTYVPLWTHDAPCDCYQLWRWRRKGEMVDLRTVAGSDQGRFAELVSEFLGFVDDTRSDEESFRLHRSVTDAPLPAR